MPGTVRPVKPEVSDGTWIFITAFFDLSTCRSVGSEAVGDIPYTAILTWLEYWGIGRDDSEIYLEVIPAMDRIYLEHIHKKRKESLDKAGKVGGSKTPKQGATRARR